MSVLISVRRHAGALVPAKGIVDVAITVADSTPVTENSGYDCALIVTVSHTRFENVPFETPEAMFVPFRAGQSIVQHAQLERPVRLVLGAWLTTSFPCSWFDVMVSCRENVGRFGDDTSTSDCQCSHGSVDRAPTYAAGYSGPPRQSHTI
jgi:hypothetical protein